MPHNPEEFNTLLTRLRENDTTLTRVNLNATDGWSLSANEVRELATALSSNSTVTYLVLDGNNIGDAGAGAIATALENNSSISYLSLWRSEIQDAGWNAISNATRQNHGLAINGIPNRHQDGELGDQRQDNRDYQADTLHILLSVMQGNALTADQRGFIQTPIFQQVQTSIARSERTHEAFASLNTDSSVSNADLEALWNWMRQERHMPLTTETIAELVGQTSAVQDTEQ